MSQARINIIVACSNNRVIGVDGGLPWRMKDDLLYFKAITLNNIVIMGRKTWDSLPKKPLPARMNIVISSTLKYDDPDVFILRDLGETLELIKETVSHPFYGYDLNLSDEELDNLILDVFIIGGAQIYEASLPYVDRIHMTCIDVDIEGDTFFPEIDMDEWKEVDGISGEKNTDNNYAYTIKILDRIR